MAAVRVVPIPARLASRWASSWIRRLASWAMRFSSVSGAVPPSWRSNASVAIREATSPAWAPPIPSATAKTGARAKYASSLALR
jgi:hypothetical protein